MKLYNIIHISTKLSLILGALVFAAGHSGLAQAYSCSNTTLTANDGCVGGSAFLDTPLNVNTDAPFGFSNWIPLDTSNDGGLDDNEPGFLVFTDAGTSGNWIITFTGQDPWAVYQDLMITLQGTLLYVAYSLVPTDKIGTYSVGSITDPDLVHARLWGAPVPIPAAVWLFGSGLLGLIGIARKKVA